MFEIIIVAILVIFFMAVSSVFRWIVFALGLFLFAYFDSLDKENKRQGAVSAAMLQEKARSLAGNIHLSDVVVVNGLSRSGEVSVDALLRNDSQYTVEKARLHVTVASCSSDSDDKNCLIIGDESTYYFGKVPPNQARRYSWAVRFYNLPTNIPYPRVKYYLSEVS